MWHFISGAKTPYERLLSRNQEPYRQTAFNLVSRLAKEGKSEELQNMKTQYEERFSSLRFRFNGQIMASYAARQVKLINLCSAIYNRVFLNQNLYNFQFSI